MPKTLARSVIAKAGMPWAAARSTAWSRRTIPSVMENSLWSRRWTKGGFGMRETRYGENSTTRRFVQTPQFDYDRKLSAFSAIQRRSRSPREFHDHDQRHSRNRLRVVGGTCLGRNRIQ